MASGQYEAPIFVYYVKNVINFVICPYKLFVCKTHLSLNAKKNTYSYLDLQQHEKWFTSIHV